MPDVLEKPFQRHQPLTKPEPHPATQAGSVGPSEDPVVASPQGVCPKTGFPFVQRQIADPDREPGPRQIIDTVDDSERPHAVLCHLSTDHLPPAAREA